MTELAKLLYAFWNKIEPAYVTSAVPSEDIDGNPVRPPYITYDVVTPTAFNDALQQVRVWTYSTSLAPLMDILDRISAAIPPDEGTLFNTTRGVYWIRRGNPWQQVVPSPEDEQNYKTALVNVTIGNLTGG